MTEPDPSTNSTLNGDLFEALHKAASQYNHGEFWESHETLEAVWLHADEPLKRFLQGIIQSAAAMHHLVRGNYKGTMSLLNQSLEKLQASTEFPELRQTMDLEALLNQLEWIRSEVETLGPAKLSDFPVCQLPKLEPAPRR